MVVIKLLFSDSVLPSACSLAFCKEELCSLLFQNHFGPVDSFIIQLLSITILILLGAQIIPNLANGNTSKQLLCPFHLFPSFFQYVLAFCHSKTFQPLCPSPDSFYCGTVFRNKDRSFASGYSGSWAPSVLWFYLPGVLLQPRGQGRERERESPGVSGGLWHSTGHYLVTWLQFNCKRIWKIYFSSVRRRKMKTFN